MVSRALKSPAEKKKPPQFECISGEARAPPSSSSYTCAFTTCAIYAILNKNTALSWWQLSHSWSCSIIYAYPAPSSGAAMYVCTTCSMYEGGVPLYKPHGWLLWSQCCTLSSQGGDSDVATKILKDLRLPCHTPRYHKTAGMYIHAKIKDAYQPTSLLMQRQLAVEHLQYRRGNHLYWLR